MQHLLAAALTFCFVLPLFANSAEDARLNTFFKAYLDEEFKHKPFDATRLGDHRFDHLLDDLTPKARAANIERTRKALEDLPKQVDYKKLSRSAQIDYEILKHSWTYSLWLAENARPFEEDPRVYNEYITESVYLLLTQSTQTKATNVKNCVARMAQIPKVVAAARESLGKPPKVFVETAIRQNRGAISFYESGIFEAAGETPALSELSPAAKKLVPVLKDYQKFLEDVVLPRASGEWHRQEVLSQTGTGTRRQPDRR